VRANDESFVVQLVKIPPHSIRGDVETLRQLGNGDLLGLCHIGDEVGFSAGGQSRGRGGRSVVHTPVLPDDADFCQYCGLKNA
jgi:hypothetical protein